jgi:hypothetical protein
LKFPPLQTRDREDRDLAPSHPWSRWAIRLMDSNAPGSTCSPDCTVPSLKSVAIVVGVASQGRQQMRLKPFKQVGEVLFTASRDEVLRTCGPPVSAQRNDVGLNELDYGDVVYRFQDGGRLEEVTQQASVVALDAVAVPFTALHQFIREQDDEAFERAGFVVSPRYGLAFDPACPCWVTALAAHCIDTWLALR